MASASNHNDRTARAHGLRRYRPLILTLSAVVVFITTYLLILPALTLDKDKAAEQGGISVSSEASVEQTDGSNTSVSDQKTEETQEKKTEATQAAAAESEKSQSAQKQSEAVQSDGKKAEAAESKEKAAEYKAGKLSFEGEGYNIEVVYGKDAQIPEGTKLVVEEIEKKDDTTDYIECYSKALKAVKEDDVHKLIDRFDNAKFYDITLMADGSEIEPVDDVKVTVSYDKEFSAEKADRIRVVHFTENEMTGETDVAVLKKEDVEATVKKGIMKEASFKAESFSVYGVIVEPAPSVDNLAGSTVKISNTLGGQTRYLGNSVIGSNPSRISKVSDASAAAEWTFEATETPGVYSISTSTNEGKRYINMTADSNGNANLSLASSPQQFNVSQNGSNYLISASIGGTTYYINQYQDVGGDGFAGWMANNYGSQLEFTFTSPVLENDDEYMVLVKQGSDYYIVLNDGKLAPAEYTDDGRIKVAEPMLWDYTGDHLYHHSLQAGFTPNNLPSDYYYRYIDPSQVTGLNEDNENNTTYTDSYWSGRVISERALWSDTSLVYSDHKLKSADSDYYIGVDSNLQNIIGGQSSSDAAEIYFAKITEIPPSSNKNHTVNHIDISIAGSASLDVPLAYGDYYYYVNGERRTLTVTKDNDVTLNLNIDQVDITPEDMKHAQITAFSEKKGEVLNNAFYITGYSRNRENQTSTQQIRIEGSFKVSDLPPYENITVNNNVEENVTAEQLQARLENKITYTVTVSKDLTFVWKYPYGVDDEGNVLYAELYDANNQQLSSVSRVNLGKSFTYWDGMDSPVWDELQSEAWDWDDYKDQYTGNECPPIVEIDQKTEVPRWQAGHIIYDTAGLLGSGMDFKLEAHGQGDNNNVAIEITKTLLTDTGEVLHPRSTVTNQFLVYQKNNSNQTDVDKVIDVGAGDTPLPIPEGLYNGYSGLPPKAITVGQSGEGLVYDYDVKAGMTYVREDQSSIPQEIIDQDGKRWQYVRTYVDTEYAWRQTGDEDKTHHADGVTSIPEVLGKYIASEWWTETKAFETVDEAEQFIDSIRNNALYRNIGESPVHDQEAGKWKVTYETKQANNGFLPFFFYNVYKRADDTVELPVTKTWDDFATSEYKWEATFKLQYMERKISGDGEGSPVTTWTDYDPEKTVTLTKPAGINQWSVEGSFGELPKYREENGFKYERQYSAEEKSFTVWKVVNGENQLLYSFDGTNYTFGEGADESIYKPFYDHDANENWDGDWQIIISNDVGQKIIPRKIDLSLKKIWDPEIPENASATFVLRRYLQKESVDYQQVKDNPDIVVQLQTEEGTPLSTIYTKSGLPMYIDATFAPNQTGTFKFEYAGHEYTLTNNATTGSKVTVRCGPITVSGNHGQTVIVRMIEGDLNKLVEGDSYNIRITDHHIDSSPELDTRFRQEITLPIDGESGENAWQYIFEDLTVEEGEWNSTGDYANLNIYSYYIEETEITPVGYEPQIMDSNGNVISKDNRIYNNDSDGITVTNKSPIELPFTGGSGTILYRIIGMILIAGAGCWLLLRRRKIA